MDFSPHGDAGTPAASTFCNPQVEWLFTEPVVLVCVELTPEFGFLFDEDIYTELDDYPPACGSRCACSKCYGRYGLVSEKPLTTRQDFRALRAEEEAHEEWSFKRRVRMPSRRHPPKKVLRDVE